MADTSPDLAGLMRRLYAMPVHSAAGNGLWAGLEGIQAPLRNSKDPARDSDLAQVTSPRVYGDIS